MTKDVAVVAVHGSALMDRAVAAFGAGTPAADRPGFYIEAVPSALPPLPIGYQGRCVAIPGPWRILQPARPEIHDLAATKLSRFHARDREDLRILGDTGDLTVDGLRAALDAAFAFAADEEEDPKRRVAYANLRVVIDYLEGRRRDL